MGRKSKRKYGSRRRRNKSARGKYAVKSELKHFSPSEFDTSPGKTPKYLIDRPKRKYKFNKKSMRSRIFGTRSKRDYSSLGLNRKVYDRMLRRGSAYSDAFRQSRDPQHELENRFAILKTQRQLKGRR